MSGRGKTTKPIPWYLMRKVWISLRQIVISRYKTRRNIAKVGLRSSLVTQGSSPKFSKKRNAHIISVGKPNGQLPAIKWRMPPDTLLEVHGHSMALYDINRVKLAEAIIEASGPVRVREVGTGRRPTVVISSPKTYCNIKMRVNYGAFQLVDRNVAAASTKWARWREGEHAVTYLLEEPKTLEGQSRLVVVFSALGADYDFTYNYHSSLSAVDAYRLFVLDDFGKRGAYYFADHRDEGIFRSVQLFLRHILSSIGVAESETTFAGTSKGGTAALIHGLPLGVGNIVVGAPQFKPGTYLKASAPEILDFIAGASDDAARGWLDEAVIRKIPKRASRSLVRVIVGTADHHHQAHAVPLQAELLDRGIDISLMVLQGVNHQEIGRPFGAYLSRLLKLSLAKPAVLVSSIIPYELSWQLGVEGNVAVLRLWIPAGEAVAIRVYSRGKLVESFAYSDSAVYAVGVRQNEPVRFRVHRRSLSTKRRLGVFTTHWLPPHKAASS